MLQSLCKFCNDDNDRTNTLSYFTGVKKSFNVKTLQLILPEFLIFYSLCTVGSNDDSDNKYSTNTPSYFTGIKKKF